MWKQVPDRLLTGAAISCEVAWLFCAAGIATWVFGTTGMDAGPWGASGLVTLVWLGPIGVVVGLNEFVIRPLRDGPPTPGRHKPGVL